MFCFASGLCCMWLYRPHPALAIPADLLVPAGACSAHSTTPKSQTILPSMSAAVDPFGMGNLDLGAAQQQMMYLPGASLANTIPAPSAAMLASVGIMSQDLYAPQQQQQQLVLLPAMATAQQTYGVAAPAPFSFQQQQQQQALQLRLQQQQQRQQALQFGLQQQQQQLAGLMGGPQQHRMQSEQMQLEQMLQAQAAALQQQAHQRGMFGAGHMPHQGGSPRAGQKTNVLLNRWVCEQAWKHASLMYRRAMCWVWICPVTLGCCASVNLLSPIGMSVGRHLCC
jgi:hypothetical protein